MFSFFRKKTENTIIPDWASFFDEKEYALFIKEIENYFGDLNIQYKMGDAQIHVDAEEFGFDNLGLMNVAQVCKQGQKNQYKEIINEHFDSLIRAKKFEKEFEGIKDNFEEIKKYIGVRLYDNQYVVQIGKQNTIGIDFAGDTYAMIVFDFPDSVTSIKPEQTTAWNKTTDELFEIGISNIKAKYPLTITKELVGEFGIWFVQGEHFFTPNIVFDLENRKELVGSKGSLVGLPHRHAAIIYPIKNLEVVKVIGELIPVIYGMYQEGPGSLSDNLFWYRDNIFTPLPYKIEDRNLQFSPPENFVELLNGLK